MDGLKYGLPGYEPYIETQPESNPNQLSQFDDSNFLPEEPIKHEVKSHEKPCVIKDFFAGVNLGKKTLSANDFHDEAAPEVSFVSLINTKTKIS